MLLVRTGKTDKEIDYESISRPNIHATLISDTVRGIKISRTFATDPTHRISVRIANISGCGVFVYALMNFDGPFFRMRHDSDLGLFVRGQVLHSRDSSVQILGLPKKPPWETVFMWRRFQYFYEPSDLSPILPLESFGISDFDLRRFVDLTVDALAK